MKIIATIGIFFMRLIYFFMKLLKTKNKIVFISRQSDKLSLDLSLLKNELEDKDIELVFITKKVKKDFISVFKSIFIMLKQMYHLATSKVCVIDGYNITVSVLKHKKSLKVIQIWHSLGAIKKFGYQSLNTPKQKEIARVMHMHENYDYIISGSLAMTKYFSKAFNYPKSKFYSLGLPRIDYILNTEKENKKKVYSNYPEFKNRKIILYVPTFRDNNDYQINELINAIDLKKYILIIKVHPNMDYKIDKKKNVYTCDDISSLDLLSVSNYVITDYSAISIEAAIIDKPIYLYVYDYDDYKKNPGINTDLYKDLKGCVFKDPNELFDKLDNSKYDMNVLKRYKNKYVCNTKGTVTKNITEFILEKVR